MKILLPLTKTQGLAGEGEQINAPGRRQRGGGNVKILLPLTKTQGLAGNGEQISSAAGPRESAKEPAENPCTKKESCNCSSLLSLQ